MPEVGQTPVLLIGWYKRAVQTMDSLGHPCVIVIEPKNVATARLHKPDDQLIVVPDTTSVEAVLAGLARRGLGLGDFSRVCSIREFSLVTASALAAMAGLPGMGVDAALALRDKFLQKRLVRAAGLPVTDCRVVTRLQELEEESWTRPVVVKPLAGGGARDTHLLHTREALSELLQGGDRTQDEGPWLVEDFVDGAELHADGVVRDGQLKFMSLSRYLQNIIDIRTGGLVGSVVLDPDRYSTLYAQAGELAQRSLAALGHRDGIFHLEAFQRADGLVFSECAGRIGGGMIREVVEHHFHVPLVEEWCRANLGMPHVPPPGPRAGSSGFVQLTAPPGRVADLPAEQDILARSGCIAAHLDVKEGGAMPDATLGSNLKAGSALVTGADEEQVEQRARDLAAWFRDRAGQSVQPATESAQPVTA